MSSMFHFKQFSIDQANCAMKVNTDGVLVAALADFEDSTNILDVGTGTGLIALMLAQKYNNAFIDAIEIDKNAAVTALKNFSDSPFSNRIKLFPVSVMDYFEKVNQKYDLIISNPPFFINSLSIHDNYSIGDFEKDALKCLDELFKTNQLVFLVGGSGLYINAVL